MEKEIAIFITCYNHQDYIQQCIESVKNQTFAHWKCFLVDDNSSDSSFKIIQELTSNDERFLVTKNSKNLGKSRTLNNLIENLNVEKYEFTALLDSDDCWMPNKLELQLKLVEQSNTSLVHTEGYIEDSRTKTDKSWGQKKEKQLFSNIHRNPNVKEGEIFKELIIGNFIFYSSILIKSSLLVETQFNNLIRRSMDWLFLIKATKNIKVGYLKEPLAIYRIHGENLQNKISDSLEVTLPRKYVLSNYQDQMSSRTKSDHYFAIARSILNETKISSKREFFIYVYAGFLYNPFTMYWLKLKLLFIKKIFS
jgi:glycosyltransferase involved in cell wall biosynthesis